MKVKSGWLAVYRTPEGHFFFAGPYIDRTQIKKAYNKYGRDTLVDWQKVEFKTGEII